MGTPLPPRKKSREELRSVLQHSLRSLLRDPLIRLKLGLPDHLCDLLLADIDATEQQRLYEAMRAQLTPDLVMSEYLYFCALRKVQLHTPVYDPNSSLFKQYLYYFALQSLPTPSYFNW